LTFDEGYATQWGNHSTGNRSVDLPLDGGSIPSAVHLTECTSYGQKGLSSLGHGPLELAVESMKFHSVKSRKGSENVSISQLEGCFAIQAEGSFTIHFFMAIRAVNYLNGLFAIQNTIPKIDLQDPGLELVCDDIKLFRYNLL